MLEAIRKRSAGIVVKALLGLLILSFAMWGIADVFNPSGTDQTLATVGELTVQPEQVRREYQSEIERLSNTFGTRIDAEQARMFGIGRAVVQRIVERTLYDLGAKDLGIQVSDDLVRSNIRTHSGFKNAKGEFERARFEQTLQSNRLSEATYVELTRGDIGRTQYLSMVNTVPLAPRRLLNSLYRHRNEKRIAETVTFNYDAVTGVAEPDDATLAKFHEENARNYTAPEYRKLTFISLTAADLAREIAVSDDAIATSYEERLSEFSEPEKRTLQQLRFKDEASAKAAHARLKTGDNFLKVAKELADMDKKATQLGDMKKCELLPGLAEAAFGLDTDTFTQPLKSVLGWHILRLNGVIPARQKTLEEMSTELKTQIAAEKAIDSLYNLANRMEDELGGGASLEETALALNLPLKKQGELDSKGLTPAGTRVDGLPEGKFLEVAFATGQGQESILSEAGNDGYFIVRVDAVSEPELRPLGSIRNQVVDNWKSRQRQELAQKEAEVLVTALKSGGEIASLASQKGLSVTTTGPIARNGGGPLPREMVSRLFDAKIGESVTGPASKGYMVARMKSSVAADPIADVDKVKKLGDELNNAIRSDLMSQLANGLGKRFPVSINSEAVNAQF